MTLRSISDAVVTIAANGTVLQVNPAALAMIEVMERDNLNQRAEQIGARFTSTSRPGEGTTIDVIASRATT